MRLMIRLCKREKEAEIIAKKIVCLKTFHKTFFPFKNLRWSGSNELSPSWWCFQIRFKCHLMFFSSDFICINIHISSDTNCQSVYTSLKGLTSRSSPPFLIWTSSLFFRLFLIFSVLSFKVAEGCVVDDLSHPQIETTDLYGLIGSLSIHYSTNFIRVAFEIIVFGRLFFLLFHTVYWQWQQLWQPSTETINPDNKIERK